MKSAEELELQIKKEALLFADENHEMYRSRHNVCRIAYEAGAKKYAAQVRWVNVSDRLPEKGERVLCSSIYGVQIGWLTNRGDWQFTNGGSQISITHWQPLPSLPTAPKD